MAYREGCGRADSGWSSSADGGQSSRVLSAVQLVVGVVVVCAGLVAIRAWQDLLAGVWYLPVMLLFLVVMTVGAGLASRGVTGLWDWWRG